MPKSGRTRAERRKVIFKNQRGRCYYCSNQMKLAQGAPNSATFEHCVPKSKGGTLSYWNTMLVCQRCNTERGHDEAPRPHPWDSEHGIWRDRLMDECLTGDARPPEE